MTNYTALIDSIGYPRSPRTIPTAAVANKVPELPEAIAHYDALAFKAEDAKIALEDFGVDCRRKQAVRTAAIAEAGRAVAGGTKRPAIPEVLSAADEDAEAQILAHVARVRRVEADRAADAVDNLVAQNGDTLAAHIAPDFGPNVEAAAAALDTLVSSLAKAQGSYRQTLALRAAGIVSQSGRPVRTSALADVVDALTRATDPGANFAKAQLHGAPDAPLAELARVVQAMRGIDIGAGVNADTGDMLPPGVNAALAARRLDVA